MWLVLWDHSLAFRYCDRHQWPSIILLPYLSDINCIDIVQDKVQGIKHGPTLQLNECQCKWLADESLSKVRSVLQSKGFLKQSQTCSRHSKWSAFPIACNCDASKDIGWKLLRGFILVCCNHEGGKHYKRWCCHDFWSPSMDILAGHCSSGC